MTFKVDDRTRETSITTGLGDYALLGAPTAYDPFSALGVNTYTLAYVTNDVDFENGLYQVGAGNTLKRTVCYSSSNADAFVNWGVNSGTKKIRCGLPAKAAMPRRLSKAVGGGAGTTVLTMDEQLNDQLEYTGALTGNRIMEVDGSVPGVWEVYNNTSGAFTLTFRATGQTGVAIKQGQRTLVYCDGTDIRALTHFPSGLDVTGNVVATGNVTAGGTVQGASVTDTYITMSGAQINRAGAAVEIQASAGGDAQIFGLDAGKKVKFDSSTGAVSLGGATAATGYTSSGDLTLPAARGVRANNVPKAWLNMNGQGTIAINDSFNVTSLTDNGTGNYTITLTNAIGNTNYATFLTPSQNGDGTSVHGGGPAQGGTFSTTQRQVYTREGTVNTDYAEVNVLIMGD